MSSERLSKRASSLWPVACVAAAKEPEERVALYKGVRLITPHYYE